MTLSNVDHCPRCDSPAPNLHPAVQYEGEAQICPHPFHDERRARSASKRPPLLPQLMVHPDGRWAVKMPRERAWWVSDDAPGAPPYQVSRATLRMDPAWVELDIRMPRKPTRPFSAEDAK